MFGLNTEAAGNLSAGADPQVDAQSGVNALIAAAVNGHESCVAALLSAGPNLQVRDRSTV